MAAIVWWRAQCRKWTFIYSCLSSGPSLLQHYCKVWPGLHDVSDTSVLPWNTMRFPLSPVHLDAPLNFSCPLFFFFFYTAIYLSHGADIFIFTASSTLLRGFMSTDFNLPSLPSFFPIPLGEWTSHFAKYPHFKGFYTEGRIPSS